MRIRHLSKAQVDAIFRERLAHLEATHLHALINERVKAAMGVGADGEWDTAQAALLVDTLRSDWDEVNAGLEE